MSELVRYREHSGHHIKVPRSPRSTPLGHPAIYPAVFHPAALRSATVRTSARSTSIPSTPICVACVRKPAAIACPSSSTNSTNCACRCRAIERPGIAVQSAAGQRLLRNEIAAILLCQDSFSAGKTGQGIKGVAALHTHAPVTSRRRHIKKRSKLGCGRIMAGRCIFQSRVIGG